MIETSDVLSFTGREFDAANNLYDYRGRFYNAEIGRFISADMIGFSAGDANLYRYVLNAPHVLVDPFGTMALVDYSVTNENEAVVFTAGPSAPLYSDIPIKIVSLETKKVIGTTTFKSLSKDFVVNGYWDKAGGLIDIVINLFSPSDIGVSGAGKLFIATFRAIFPRF